MPQTDRERLGKTAKKNGLFSMGIDTEFYPSGLHNNRYSITENIKVKCEFAYSYWKWIVSELGKGRIVLPLSFICLAGDFLAKFIDLTAKPSSARTISDYYTKAEKTEFNNELMATYIRFISSDDGLYDREDINRSQLNILLWKYRIYCTCLSCIFSLRPSTYITWQRSYLGQYAACFEAIKKRIPVVLLGTSDNSLYKCSDRHVPRHWEWITRDDANSIFTNEKTLAEKKELAKKNLDKRLAGDKTSKSLINYMYYNPYSKEFRELGHKELLEQLGLRKEVFKSTVFKNRQQDNRGFICVFMHMFDDYHHHGVLPEFASSYYHWLLITIKILEEEKVPYVVKIHPTVMAPNRQEFGRRAIAGLSSIAQTLKIKIPLSFTETSPELIAKGMKLAVTVSGTIATEILYLRRAVICCGNPPYKDFVDTRRVTDLKSYKRRICSYHQEPQVSQAEIEQMLTYLACKKEITEQRIVKNSDRECLTRHGIWL